jgi:hypothetical protein
MPSLVGPRGVGLAVDGTGVAVAETEVAVDGTGVAVAEIVVGALGTGCSVLEHPVMSKVIRSKLNSR